MSSLWKVGVLLLLVVAVLPALNLAYTDHSRTPHSVENESLTVDYDAPVPVDYDAPEYSGTVALTSSSGTNLTAGTDYTWNATTGTVMFLNTSATTAGNTAHIDYEYLERTQTTQLVSGSITPWGLIMGLLLVFCAVYAGYEFAVGGGGGGGL